MVQFPYQSSDTSSETVIRLFAKKLLFLFLFCLGALIASPMLLCKNIHSVNLGAFEYPPFYWYENGKVSGIAVDIIDKLFKRLNIETDVTLYPLKRTLNYAKQGKIDAIMILIKTTERSEYLYYTTPIMKVRGVIWSAIDRKGGTIRFSNLEDLKPYKIGATIGYSYGQKFDNLLNTMDVYWAATDYMNYKKLMAHRIDVFPGNEIVAKGLFKKYPELRGKFHHSDKYFIEWILHMGISKKSALQQMLPEINIAIKDLKDGGVIEEIIRKHTE